MSYDAETLNVINTVHLFEIWCTKLWKEYVYRHFYRHFNRHFDSHNILLLLSTFLTDIFFYPLIFRQIWRTSSDAYGLSNHWICNCFLLVLHCMINIWLKFQVNVMKRTMQIKYLSSFLSSHLTILAFEFIFAIDICDRRYFSRHFWTDNWNSTITFEWQTAFNTENATALLRISCKT